ncbi:Dirigent protein [Heracleum sosnowskyi]|uniref:Dirigent protein n=1 Tax=Heracleum sosnowskyi TaxID=360622 RepID=A0AAD8J136_9APIA|nr:Dirigent protein [Heracleum sosnowskyi]
MGKIYVIALALCSIILTISVVESIDESPEAVEKWFKKLGHKKERVTKLHFFLHEKSGGSNQTAYQVAQSNITLTSPTFFGQVSMIDDILREGSAPDSQVLGRAQGLTGLSSLEEASLIMTMNFVFTTGKYNGSTLSVLGRNPFSKKYREMAIIGGSGVFRLARGIITTQTSLFNPTSGDVISEYNVVVIHY